MAHCCLTSQRHITKTTQFITQFEEFSRKISATLFQLPLAPALNIFQSATAVCRHREKVGTLARLTLIRQAVLKSCIDLLYA